MFFQLVKFQEIALKIIQQLRIDIFSKVQSLGLKYFDQTPAGSIVSRVTNDTEAIKGYVCYRPFNLYPKWIFTNRYFDYHVYFRCKTGTILSYFYSIDSPCDESYIENLVPAFI